MNIELKNENKLKREYKISISAKDLEDGVDERVKKIAPKVKMKGYRDGNVPYDVVRNKYFVSLVNDYISEKSQELIKDEIEKNKLEVASNPVIREEINFTEIQDISLSAELELMPNINEIDYSKIEAEIPKLEMKEEDMEKEIQSILDSRSTVEEIEDKDHTVQDKEVVVIDFLGSIDGVPFEGGKGSDYQLEIGSKSFIDTFEEQLIDTKVEDEIDVKVTFPDNYQKQDLAGKKANFKTKIKKIYKKKTPELNEDFVKSIGLKTVEELKEKITTEVSAVMESTFHARIRRKLFDFLLEKDTFDLPESVAQREIEARIKNAEEKGESANRKDIEKKVKQDLSIYYYIQFIMKKEDKNITDEDFSKFITRMAIRDNLGDPQMIMQTILSNKALAQAIGESFKEEIVIKYIIDNIKKKEVQLNKEGFVKYIKDIGEGGENWKLKRKGILG